jgi:hypothetical protein
MEAHDDRRDRRARRGLGHEVGAIGVACSDNLLLESHGGSIADGGLPGVAERSFWMRFLPERGNFLNQIANKPARGQPSGSGCGAIPGISWRVPYS